jgi:hypothetical protein
MNYMSDEGFSKVLLPGLRKVYQKHIDNFPSIVPDIFAPYTYPPIPWWRKLYNKTIRPVVYFIDYVLAYWKDDCWN